MIKMLAELVRQRTYFPDRASDLSVQRLGLPHDSFQDLALRTGDGLTLHGWHLLAEGRHALDRTAWDRELAAGRPLALFFSGNGGNRSYRLSEAEILTQAGSDVFLFDYRGYGDNSGTPSEAALTADARAVWDHAVTERRVEPRKIVLYGESLGGAVATRLASEKCQAGSPPAGLILRSTFSTLADAARHLFPVLPVNMLLQERYASLEWIGKVTCPILMLHGVRDLVVPHYLGRKLFDAAPKRSADGTPIEFIDLPHADHNDVLEADGELLQEAIDGFMARLARRAS
jgi:pimeloyl-ACP methyl ester carboxylesterase